jgi:hypothetical protein
MEVDANPLRLRQKPREASAKMMKEAREHFRARKLEIHNEEVSQAEIMKEAQGDYAE